jgi:hypothetical protein
MWTAVVVATLLVVVSACSSGTTKSATATTATTLYPATTANTTASTATTTPASPTTQTGSPALAGLVRADLPAGWQDSTAGQFIDDFGQTASCMHLDPARKVTSSAASASIVMGSSASGNTGAQYTAASKTTMLSPPTVAAQEVEVAITPAGAACEKAIIAQSLPAGSTITITPIAAPALGDKATGLHFSASNSQGALSSDSFFIAKGGEEITVQFSAVNGTFPAQVEQAALRKLAVRI